MENRIIYLAGFMGAGKSTIGPILANTLGWSFYDLDRVIEVFEGKKIKEIFAEKGESYFRELETDQLLKISENKNLVLALGGGTIINPTNLEIMKRTGTIIYLKVSADYVYKRLMFKRDRPVLQIEGNENPTREQMLEKIESVFNSRKKYYEQADIVIDTDNVSVGITVDKIAKIFY